MGDEVTAVFRQILFRFGCNSGPPSPFGRSPGVAFGTPPTRGASASEQHRPLRYSSLAGAGPAHESPTLSRGRSGKGCHTWRTPARSSRAVEWEQPRRTGCARLVHTLKANGPWIRTVVAATTRCITVLKNMPPKQWCLWSPSDEQYRALLGAATICGTPHPRSLGKLVLGCHFCGAPKLSEAVAGFGGGGNRRDHHWGPAARAPHHGLGSERRLMPYGSLMS